MDGFLPGSASLVDMIDLFVLVLLRDGTKYTGTLRSYDQFGNLVVQDTTELILVKKKYSQTNCGLYLIRGENIVLLAESDKDKYEGSLVGLEKCDRSVMDKMLKVLTIDMKTKSKHHLRVMHENGFCTDINETDQY